MAINLRLNSGIKAVGDPTRPEGARVRAALQESAWVAWGAWNYVRLAALLAGLRHPHRCVGRREADLRKVPARGYRPARAASRAVRSVAAACRWLSFLE